MAFPVVNLRPRVLPQAQPTDLAGGIQQGIEGLELGFERRRAEERQVEASELEFQREQQLVTQRGEIQSEQIGQRGEQAESLAELRARLGVETGKELGEFDFELGREERGAAAGLAERRVGVAEAGLELEGELGREGLGLRSAEISGRAFDRRTQAEAARQRAQAGLTPEALRLELFKKIQPFDPTRLAPDEDPEFVEGLNILLQGLGGGGAEGGAGGGAPVGTVGVGSGELGAPAGSQQSEPVTETPPGTGGRTPGGEQGRNAPATTGNEEKIRTAPLGALFEALKDEDPKTIGEVFMILSPEKQRALRQLLEEFGAEGVPSETDVSRRGFPAMGGIR